MKTRFLVLALLAVALPTHAADKNGEFYVRGVGGQTCASYLAEKAKNSVLYYMFRSWLNGYWSATNRVTPDTYDATPKANTDGLAAIVAAYCKKVPDQAFWTVAYGVLKASESKRLKEKSEIVKATVGDKTVPLFRATLQSVQQGLAERGYYRSSVDGLFGPATAAAIKAFQHDEKLPETGLPDQQTIFKLLP